MNTLSTTFNILSLWGMWRPLSWSSGWKSFLYDHYTFFMTLVLYTFTMSQCIGLFTLSNNVKEFTHGSYLLLTTTASCGKFANVIKKREEIINLTNVLTNRLCKPRNSDEIKIQLDCERQARFNTIWYTALTATTVSLITLRSFMVDIPKRNLTFDSWLPYEFNSSQIGFYSAYIHQTIAHMTSAAMASAYDTLVPGFMIQTCAQMKILKYRFQVLPRMIEDKKKSLRDNNNNSEENNKSDDESIESAMLKECVDHHLEIFRLTEMLNDIFGVVVCLQLVVSSLVLCVSVYEISTMALFSSEFAAIVMYLTCMLLQIFLFCFYGGELTLQSVDISDTVYRMDWLSFGIKAKKNLITIIMRSLRPMSLTCASVITLSLDSFTNLVKLSYSAYNVLQQSSA